MLNKYARAFFAAIFTPIAKLLIKLKITPDMVTIAGTLGIVLTALIFYPQGQLFWGTFIITFFIFSDLLDGLMARELGSSGPWGAFLDSSMDRVQDGVIFAAIAWWFFTAGNDAGLATLALVCLVLGQLVSYIKARAQALGAEANVGIAERSERLVLVLVLTGLVGLGLPQVVLTAGLALLAVASVITIAQRVHRVYQQLR